MQSASGKSYVRARMSSSRKTDDGYQTDWSGYASFFGKSEELAKTLCENDTIKILNCAVTTNYQKSSGKTYTNYTIFDFEIARKADDSQGSGYNSQQVGSQSSVSDPAQATGQDFINVPDNVMDELPFN